MTDKIISMRRNLRKLCQKLSQQTARVSVTNVMEASQIVSPSMLCKWCFFTAVLTKNHTNGNKRKCSHTNLPFYTTSVPTGGMLFEQYVLLSGQDKSHKKYMSWVLLCDGGGNVAQISRAEVDIMAVCCHMYAPTPSDDRKLCNMRKHLEDFVSKNV